MVVPTASALGPEIVEVYDVLFRRLGAADVVGVRPESREEADDANLPQRPDPAGHRGVPDRRQPAEAVGHRPAGTPASALRYEAAHARGATPSEARSAGASVPSRSTWWRSERRAPLRSSA